MFNLDDLITQAFHNVKKTTKAAPNDELKRPMLTSKPQVKPETKPEPKPETKPEPKPQPKPQPVLNMKKKTPHFTASDIEKMQPVGESTTPNMLKVSDLTRALHLIDNGLNDDEKYKLQNFEGTNFPKNTPVYINGPKGSGKTYMLGALLQFVFKNSLAQRLFYIYAENVDTTISRAIPKDKIYQVPKSLALGLIVKYLNKKTRVCACSKFLTSLDHFGGIDKFKDSTLDQLLTTEIYWDNFLDDLTKRKRMSFAVDLYNYAIHTLKKYTKDTILRIGDVPFNLGSITADDFDLFVMDDIAQFSDLLGTTRNNSKIYKYLTITRQNQSNFYLAGQELGQLSKMYREQLGGLVVLYGSNLDDLNKYRLDRSTITTIKNKFLTMNQHDGILYNYNTREIEAITNE